MKNGTQFDIEKTENPVTIEKLQYDLQKLRLEVRSLQIQVAKSSNIDISKNINAVEEGEFPHETTAKCQRCKSCKYMRMPHKSNPHYTCTLRHQTIETTWTCAQFSDKKSQSILEPIPYVGH